MVTVLLENRTGKEPSDYSVALLFSSIKRILEAEHDVILTPDRHELSSAAIEAWVSHHASNADLFVGCDYQIIRLLRQDGWTGRVLFTALGDLPRGASGLRNALPYLYTTDAIWCSSSADQMIYNSLIAQDGSAPTALVIPYGIDCLTYQPFDPTSTRRLRTAWGISRDDFVIAYAGRITAEKNFHSILPVVKELSNSGLAVRLLVAGIIVDSPFSQFRVAGGNLTRKIHSSVEKLDLKQAVTFYPWLTPGQLNEMYNVSDCVLNLTLHHDENFGYSQAEAMCAGLPVVATAWGGLKDIVVDEKTGFLIDTWISNNGIRFDMPRIIESLIMLAEERETRQRLSSSSAVTARQQYSWGAFSENLLGAITLLLKPATVANTANYSDFGSSFDFRFRAEDRYSGKITSVAPIYKGYCDYDYLRLIEPYTSLGKGDQRITNAIFAALPGEIVGRYFVSSDLLWPVRTHLSDQDIYVLRQLKHYEAQPRDSIDCPDDVIFGLVRKGLVGYSRAVSNAR